MKKLLNYAACLVALLAGIVLLLSGELSTVMFGVYWMGLCWLSGRTTLGKRMWKSFWKTNMEIGRHLDAD